MHERTVGPWAIVDERADPSAGRAVRRFHGNDIRTQLREEQPRELTSLVGEVEDSIRGEHHTYQTVAGTRSRDGIGFATVYRLDPFASPDATST